MNATIAQVVERYIGNVEVTGPTPVSSLQAVANIHLRQPFLYLRCVYAHIKGGSYFFT